MPQMPQELAAIAHCLLAEAASTALTLDRPIVVATGPRTFELWSMAHGMRVRFGVRLYDMRSGRPGLAVHTSVGWEVVYDRQGPAEAQIRRAVRAVVEHFAQQAIRAAIAAERPAI